MTPAGRWRFKFVAGVTLATGAAGFAALAVWHHHRPAPISAIRNATPFQISNAIEALLWITMGLSIFLVTLWKGQARKSAIAALTLVLFGISDIVETQTGAWWRPWWLFVWKAICVLILLPLVVQQLRKASAQNSTTRTRP